MIEAATEVDDVAPVSEHVVLRLRASAADLGAGRHLLLHSGRPTTAEVGSLLGYAFVEDTEPTIRDVELVVHPDHRRVGLGRELLLQAAATGTGTGTGTGERRQVRVWSHGDHPGARALAATLGYRVVRTLLQLRRPLADPESIDVPVLGPGITLRAFHPGADDEPWLRLNARAFAHHPEQGRMTLADLSARMEEPWFDAKGFLIAQKQGQLIGFHWTKVHPGGLGEVYVLGVDPDLHGAGLGRALTLAGLRYLAEQGLRTVLLYVESDNAAALAIYHRLGFSSWSTDVMYANDPGTSTPTETAG